MEPVPVTGLAANFSPMPRMAPPPLGNEMEGAAGFGSASLRAGLLSGEATGSHLAGEWTLAVCTFSASITESMDPPERCVNNIDVYVHAASLAELPVRPRRWERMVEYEEEAFQYFAEP